jgi:hypothetical protein
LRTTFAVAITTPDGRVRETTAIFEVPHVSGPLPPLALLRLPEMSEADVPPGSEVRRLLT